MIKLERQEFSRPRLDDERKVKSLRLSEDHLEKAFDGGLSRLQLIGDWHTHVGSDSFQPSETDIGAWGARADRVSWKAGRPPGYVGLILVGDPRAQGMQLRAWFDQPLRWDIPPEEREPKPLPIQ